MKSAKNPSGADPELLQGSEKGPEQEGRGWMEPPDPAWCRDGIPAPSLRCLRLWGEPSPSREQQDGVPSVSHAACAAPVPLHELLRHSQPFPPGPGRSSGLSIKPGANTDREVLPARCQRLNLELWGAGDAGTPSWARLSRAELWLQGARGDAEPRSARAEPEARSKGRRQSSEKQLQGKQTHP